MVSFFEMTLKCPLLKWLFSEDVAGVDQYHKERSQLIRQYAVDILQGGTPAPILIPSIQDEMTNAKVDENLQRIVADEQVTIEGEESAPDIMGFVSIHVYKGSYKTRPAIFLISTSKTSHAHYAYELVLAMDHFYGSRADANMALCVIYPMKDGGEVREYPKNGVLTSKGTLDKRYAGTWDMIRTEAQSVVKAYSDEMTRQQKASTPPDPIFGDCLFCPYHNVEVDCKGHHIRCRGGSLT